MDNSQVDQILNTFRNKLKQRQSELAEDIQKGIDIDEFEFAILSYDKQGSSLEPRCTCDRDER